MVKSAATAERLSAWRYLLLSIGVVLFDQLTKLWVMKLFVPGERLSVLPFFDLTLVFNEGAAFSFLSQAGGWQRWFFIGLTLLISAVLLVWLRRLRSDERWTAVGLALILGGAWGNLFDRVRLGRVVDFLDFHWQQWHWPAFNVADSAITLGVAVLILLAWQDKSRP